MFFLLPTLCLMSTLSFQAHVSCLTNHRAHPVSRPSPPPLPTPPLPTPPSLPTMSNQRQSARRASRAPACCASSGSTWCARRSGSPRSSSYGGGSAHSSGRCSSALNAISPHSRRASSELENLSCSSLSISPYMYRRGASVQCTCICFLLLI